MCSRCFSLWCFLDAEVRADEDDSGTESTWDYEPVDVFMHELASESDESTGEPPSDEPVLTEFDVSDDGSGSGWESLTDEESMESTQLDSDAGSWPEARNGGRASRG